MEALMADFKLTYATMFNPPDELHSGFDKAVETLIWAKSMA
jgi:hypothetical protein